MTTYQTKIEVVRGSVIEQNAEAIVNAANTVMRGGGALDGAIHRAAGPALLRELEAVAPHGSHTSEVVVTGGHNLPHKYIFHVAGPVWKSSQANECDALLAASYRNCLVAAYERKLESLAFPSLSTGVYGFPIERAAPLAIQTVVEWLKTNSDTSLRRVAFAMFGSDEFHVFHRASTQLL